VPTVGWIVLFGLAMSAIALVGSTTLLLPEPKFKRVVLPLVALAAGSLLGGTFFHLLPEAITQLGNRLGLYATLTGGFVVLFILEQFLQWHHCHQPLPRHRPVGYLILIADGLHNLIGGLAVGGTFVIDTELGIVTWAVAAAHEVPQELGDFGILVHSGWSKRAALAFNVLSALTFPLGGLIAYLVSSGLDVAWLLPFAAGNFLYIAAADLIPQLHAEECPGTGAPAGLQGRLAQLAAFLFGLGVLLLIALVAGR
jgi:zinc and cadmium transporter